MECAFLESFPKHRQRNMTGTAQENQQPLLLLEVFLFSHEKEKRKRKKE